VKVEHTAWGQGRPRSAHYPKELHLGAMLAGGSEMGATGAATRGSYELKSVIMFE